MFRIGGQAGQGTGIMSHVEPKPTYAVGGRVGYAQAGQVTNPFTYFSPSAVPRAGYPTTSYSSGLDLLEQSRQKFDEQQRALQKANREQLGISSVIPTDEEDFLSKIFGSDAEKLVKEKGILSASPTTKEKINAINYLQNLSKKDEDKPSEKPTATNEPRYTETKKTDPREAIKQDKETLRSLLEGEDYQDLSKAEAALILGRAIAEPGSIANKVKVASELAIPVIRAKRKEDRDVTLEAYKTYREKELEEIKAGKVTDLEKQVRAMTDAYIKANPLDKRGRDVIFNEMFEKRLGEEKSLEKSRLVGFTGIQQQLESKVNAVRKAEADKAAGKKVDEQVLNENKNFIEAIKRRYPDYYAANFPEVKADGGRVGFAEGTPEPIQDGQIESTTTPAGDGVEQTQERPVVKLSFQELRARLPKEITNDIVNLIAGSEEALQDFAYIKTQQDVNNFNVKYGVNLVLPSNK